MSRYRYDDDYRRSVASMPGSSHAVSRATGHSNSAVSEWRHRYGLPQAGRKRRLTPDDVRTIRVSASTPGKDLAERYGIAESGVCLIRQGLAYKDVRP